MIRVRGWRRVGTSFVPTRLGLGTWPVRVGTKTVPTLLLLAAAAAALAGPSVVSDPTTRTDVTHCAWYLDAAARELIPAPKDATGKPYCAKDVAAVAEGSHSIAAAFVIQDPTWGELEGPKSAPFPFARPSSPAAPSTLRLAP